MEDKKSPRYFASDLNDLHFRMCCATNALGTIREALEGGNSTPESYTDGLFAIYDYLHFLNTEMSECIAALAAKGGES